MKQKLFILDPSKDITGAFICAKNEARILKDDFETTLVIPSISKIDITNFQDFDQVVRLPIYDLRKSFFSILVYFPALIYSGFLLKSKMKKENCTLLQVNDYYMMQGVFAKLFGYKGKVFTWVRIDHRNYGSIFSKYWLRYAYNVSDKIIAVSNFIKKTLPNSEKNILLYDPILQDKNEFKIYKKDNKRKITYIANYIEGKGQNYALDAFLKIAQDYPDVELHFYGGDMGLEKNKYYKKMLEEKAGSSNCSDQVVFHSFTNDAKKILEDSYIALNFSNSESFSLTCLEASSTGRTVIATRSGGPEEIIVDNRTGLLVEPKNINQMSEAMKKLLDNENLVQEFNQNAFEYTNEKFAIEDFKEKITNIFKGKL